MHTRNPLLLLLALGALAACTRVTVFGQTVKDDHVAVRGTAAPAASAGPAVVQAGSPVTRLVIDYTAAAKKQTADDARFNGAALNKAIGSGLTARGLADLANSAVIRVAAIELDEFDVRATSNVVLMGRVASNGVLGGRVRIRDGSGTQLREFHVRADMALNVARSSDNPLENLYREFASLIVDELTGNVTQPKTKNLRL